MDRETLNELLRQAPPQYTEAFLTGQITFEEFLRICTQGDNEALGFDITRTVISDDRYFEHSKTEIIDEHGRIGSVKTLSVFDCGHSQRTHEFGGIDSFGHVVCSECLRFCDIGRHLCCIMDSVVTKKGLTVCDCHRGINRFSNRKFNKWRVR